MAITDTAATGTKRSHLGGQHPDYCDRFEQIGRTVMGSRDVTVPSYLRRIGGR